MAQRFVACDREQSFLMPPDVREWLPENHLAWFVISAVEEINLDAFYAAHRVDGRSRPPYPDAREAEQRFWQWFERASTPQEILGRLLVAYAAAAHAREDRAGDRARDQPRGLRALGRAPPRLSARAPATAD